MDPYSLDMDSWLRDFRFLTQMEFAVRSPLAQVKVANISESPPPRPLVVVFDPFWRRPKTWRGLLAQMRDIVLYEFWMAGGDPARTPGAKVLRKTDVGAGQDWWDRRR